ncbi:F0F1 ATP synthase subunit B [Candidatus Saccharibacteria bacterium]|nr:F0F1 ATP synthase subunit B [Candidatus Saccharibacteria bacterium]
MEKIFCLFASTETGEQASEGIFGALGIDWKVLIFQAIAFGILVFILAKWVYPPILAMLNRNQKLIDDSLKAAKEASAKSEKAADEIAGQLEGARKEAEDIIKSAHKQSQQMLLDAEGNATTKADAIVAAADTRIRNSVQKAQKDLRDEVVELVATATEKIIGSRITAKEDAKLVADAIKEINK